MYFPEYYNYGLWHALAVPQHQIFGAERAYVARFLSPLLPSSLTPGYTISPDNIWVLEVGRQYEITVHVFDKFNHPILVTKVCTQSNSAADESIMGTNTFIFRATCRGFLSDYLGRGEHRMQLNKWSIPLTHSPLCVIFTCYESAGHGY